MRDLTPAMFSGSLPREIQGLRYRCLAASGRGAAAHDIHGPTDSDHTDTVARRRHVREPRPLPRSGIEELDLLVRSARLLAAGEDEAIADRRGANATARGRCVGGRLPTVRTRAIALERREIR